MLPSILDLINSNNFKGIKIIAGEKGIVNKVSDTGILDYEYDKKLINKYYYINFHENQLALTTFLYAKDNPYLILDAVKYLADKKAAGLIIKNVFNLPIHDSVIRYANAKKFPIFVITSDIVYFEQFIIGVDQFIKRYKDAEFQEVTIDKITRNKSLNDEEIKELCYTINPSFNNKHFCVYISFENNLTNDEFLFYKHKYLESKIYSKVNEFIKHKGNILLIFTKDVFDFKEEAEKVINELSNIISKNTSHFVGVSTCKTRLELMGKTVVESYFASKLKLNEEYIVKFYDEINSFQFILPLLKSKEMQEYSEKTLEPLIEYDTINNTNLFDTVIAIAITDSSLKEIARALNSHENTIRYRFKQIKKVTGLDYFEYNNKEQLSIAAKIFIAMQQFN